MLMFIGDFRQPFCPKEKKQNAIVVALLVGTVST